MTSNNIRDDEPSSPLKINSPGKRNKKNSIIDNTQDILLTASTSQQQMVG